MFVPLKIRYLLNFYVSRENIKFETFVLPFYVHILLLLDKNDFMKKKNIFTLYIYFVCEDNLILFVIVYFTIKF